MARHGVNITLTVDKWEGEGGNMLRGWEGWEAECTYGICKPLLLLICPVHKFLEIVIVSKGVRGSQFQRS